MDTRPVRRPSGVCNRTVLVVLGTRARALLVCLVPAARISHAGDTHRACLLLWAPVASAVMGMDSPSRLYPIRSHTVVRREARPFESPFSSELAAGLLQRSPNAFASSLLRVCVRTAYSSSSTSCNTISSNHILRAIFRLCRFTMQRRTAGVSAALPALSPSIARPAKVRIQPSCTWQAPLPCAWAPPQIEVLMPSASQAQGP